MQAVILAAGKGARLNHLTRQRSKAMLPVLGQPMVGRVVDSLAANGIREFILVVNPDDLEIQAYFSSARRPKLHYEFAFQSQRLGMADALRCASPFIRDDFVLSACDSLIPPEQIQRIFAAWDSTPRPEAILALMPVPLDQVSSTGIVAMSGNWITRIVEKPSLADAPSQMASLPLYIFPQALLDYLGNIPLSARGEYELQDAIQQLIDERGHVLGVRVEERLTVTRPADLITINRAFLTQQVPSIIDLSGTGANSQLVPPVYIGANVKIGNGCWIGPFVYIEGPAILHDGVRIAEAVVLREAVIADHSQVHHQVVS